MKFYVHLCMLYLLKQAQAKFPCSEELRPMTSDQCISLLEKQRFLLYHIHQSFAKTKTEKSEFSAEDT